MAFLSLIHENELSNELKNKISFYKNFNCFTSSENIFNGNNVNISNFSEYFFIKKLPLFLNQINIIYVREAKNFDILSYFDEKNSMLVVNLRAIELHYRENSKKFDNLKEAIAYASIFGILALFFRQKFQFECFGSFANLSNHSFTFDTFDTYNQIVNNLFDKYKKNFFLFLTSIDPKINVFFTFGKKYVYTLAILLNEGKIGIEEVGKLLDLNENDAFVLLDEYKGVAYINYLKHQTGELL